MTHKLLPNNCPDNDIRELIVQWSELLAIESYQDALDMFPYSTKEQDWSPDLLRKTINGYGVADLDEETMKSMLEEWGEKIIKITSVQDVEDYPDFITESIEVNQRSLYGLDAMKYQGMVHYNNIPICFSISDLTARFNIMKIGQDLITLEFLDIHVM